MAIFLYAPSFFTERKISYCVTKGFSFHFIREESHFTLVKPDIFRFSKGTAELESGAIVEIALELAVGFGLGVNVGVATGLGLGVIVGVAVGLGLGVIVGVAVGVGLGLGVIVGVAVGIAVGLGLGLGVASGVSKSTKQMPLFFA